MFMHRGNHPLFSLKAILPHLLIVAVTLIAYYYIVQNQLFPNWINYIYYGVKILIAFEIILASARSFLAPALGITIGIILVISTDAYNKIIPLITSSDGWQLFIMSVIGLLISILMRL